MDFKINTRGILLMGLVPLLSFSKPTSNNSYNKALPELISCNFIGKDSVIVKKGYQLTIKVSDPKLNEELKNSIAERFFAVYPKMVKDFNPKASKNITVVFSDEDTDHPAHAMNSEIWIFTKFFTKPGRDKDIDVMVHEGFHLVQAYPDSENTPGWLVEGIADYVREVYGLSNAAGGWALPKKLDDRGNKYQASYRTTARFLLWLEKKVKKGIVQTLDKACRNTTYTDAIWKKETNKTIDELWDDYVKNYDSI